MLSPSIQNLHPTGLARQPSNTTYVQLTETTTNTNSTPTTGTEDLKHSLTGAHYYPEKLPAEDISNKTNPAGCVHGSSDANWASPRSHSGWIFSLAGGAVSWMSKLQPSTATSTTESEAISACSATRQAVYLRDVLRFCGLPQLKPTGIQNDNQGAVAWSKGLQAFAKRKHINLSLWYTNDAVERNQVEFIQTASKDNVSDILTKTLPSSQEYLKQCQRISTFLYMDRFKRPATVTKF